MHKNRDGHCGRPCFFCPPIGQTPIFHVGAAPRVCPFRAVSARLEPCLPVSPEARFARSSCATCRGRPPCLPASPEARLRIEVRGYVFGCTGVAQMAGRHGSLPLQNTKTQQQLYASVEVYSCCCYSDGCTASPAAGDKGGNTPPSL